MTPDEAIITLESFRQRVFNLAAPLRFETVDSQEMLHAVYRLRYEVVIAEGWAKPEDLPDGLETDVYDRRALQIVCQDTDGTIAACTRLVLPVEGGFLPTEAAFDLIFEPRYQVVDAGRMVIAPAYRHAPKHLILMGLLGQIWLETRSRQFTEIAMAMTAGMRRLYRMTGFHFTSMGEPRQYWGELRHPCCLDYIQTAIALEQRREQFFGSSA